MMEVKINGLPDLRQALRSIPDKLRRKALRNALSAGARVVRNAARDAAPVIPAGSLPVRRGIRKPGTVRNAISVRVSKIAKRSGDVGVYVNVKPLPGAKYRTKTTKVLGLSFKTRTVVRASQRGAKNPNDPYYWRWLEFGTKFAAPRPFLQEGAKKLGEALQVFISKIRPQIAKLNNPKGPQP